jgi:hypothetical protein
METTGRGELNPQRENADRRASTVDTTPAADGARTGDDVLVPPSARAAPHNHIRHHLQDRRGPRTGEEDGGVVETLSRM